MNDSAGKDKTSIRVGLKYCGGCDPDYDRVEFAQEIQRIAGKKIAWCGAGENGLDAVLVIAGCARACPKQELKTSARMVCISDDHASPGQVVNMLTGKEGCHEDSHQG